MRRRVLLVAAAGLAVLAATPCLKPTPLVVWNASPSVPVGLWRIVPADRLARGDAVLAWAPPEARRLAAARGYLPISVPMIKTVAALEGDRVCARGAQITIGGRLAAVRKEADPQGRPLPRWRGCRRLSAGQFLLLTAPAASFDGRYFGPVERSAILGKAVPLWLR